MIVLLERAPSQVADFGSLVARDRVPALLGGILRRGGFVLAAMNDNELQGYAAVARIAGPVHELAIEVAKSRRRRGIANALVAGVIRYIDDRVVVAHAVHDHWDVEGARLAAYAYRAMLGRMLSRAGFRTYASSDHPLDFDAVRIGARLQ